LRLLYLLCAFVQLLAAPDVSAQSLRFYGHGGTPGENFVFPDRVKIDRAPPATLASFGSGDFTVEFFMRAMAAENPNVGGCGSGIGWVNSNILIDADRFNQPRAWGIGVLNGVVAFGVTDDFSAWTLCGSTNVLDDQWHHVAVDREFGTGTMRIWVDGALDASIGAGPGGTLAYEAGFVPGNFCDEGGGSGGQSCVNSDPFLVLGAEKHGFQGIRRGHKIGPDTTGAIDCPASLISRCL